MSKNLALAEIKTLRCYAFCLFGNRVLSDRVIAAALKTLNSNSATAEIALFDFYRQVNKTARTIPHFANVGGAVGTDFHTRFLRLPLQQREVAALHDVVGFPYKDIAAITDMAESEVRLTYLTALDALRHEPVGVLIIEDEALIALELHDIVTNLGFSVAGTAKNRAEALGIIARFKPKVILADYQLRGENGVEVVLAIREQIHADVIYVTGHPDTVAARPETANDIVIAKPFTAHALEQALQNHLAA